MMDGTHAVHGADAGPGAGAEPLAGLLRDALLLDLEVTPQGRVLKLGAVLGKRTLLRSGNAAGVEALAALERLAADAACVVGHNLASHDLPILRERAPQPRLLRLPVIDTLVLSPLCFPEKPYHRLVKDYKLAHESLNDPVADARLAGELCADEFRALAGLRRTEPGLFELLHFLLAEPDGREASPPDRLAEMAADASGALPVNPAATGHPLPPAPPTADAARLPDGRERDCHDPGEPLAAGRELLFSTLGGVRPGRARAAALCREIFGRWACASVPVEDALLATRERRLALAFTVAWLRVAGSNSVLPPWVRLGHPLVGQLVRRLRETPCPAADCAYCRRVHDARAQLRAFFGFDDFRASPAGPDGAGPVRLVLPRGAGPHAPGPRPGSRAGRRGWHSGPLVRRARQDAAAAPGPRGPPLSAPPGGNPRRADPRQ